MAAKKKATPAPASVYHWFQGDSVVELVQRIQNAGPHSARLEVRAIGDAMYLSVVDTTQSLSALADDPPINNSHICPFDCPT